MERNDKFKSVVDSSKENREDLDAFSYSISHDLRAPLRAIEGVSSIVMENYGDQFDAEGKKLLNMMHSNAKRLEQLLNDLMDFCRTGKNGLQKKPLDMWELFKTGIEDLTLPFKSKPPKFELKPLPYALGDPSLIRQVVVNLLSNSLKYSQKRRRPEIEIGSFVQDKMNLYFIKDNGAGFNMRHTNKLFTAFKRLHGTEEFEGAGVGLAIVKRIIQRHGGKIWAQGKVNKGATFFFTLPRLEGKSVIKKHL